MGGGRKHWRRRLLRVPVEGEMDCEESRVGFILEWDEVELFDGLRRPGKQVSAFERFVLSAVR